MSTIIKDQRHQKEKLKIACIGNYVPRQCGIATFTRDIVESLVSNLKITQMKVEAFVVAMNDNNLSYDYPDIVHHTIRQDRQTDYLRAVKFINYSDADICVLQHEYGIFGGNDGHYILSLIRRLSKPLITTLHTVLKNPTYNQKVIVQEISRISEKIVVMSKKAVEFLTQRYGISRGKISVIDHGVPDFDYMQKRDYKKQLNLGGRKSLLTFGLLSRDKGLDTVIKALVKIVPKYPEALYIILGKTHPAVVRHSKEEYRNYLKLLVRKNNLSKNVYFDNRYISNEELFRYLVATDIYITPYLNKAQITSGTLAYAVGAGCTIISTPYWHAEELLAAGRGNLFDFNDSDALADIILDLFDHPLKMKKIREKAYKYGQKTLWPEIGLRYFNLILESIQSWQNVKHTVREESVINPLILPDFNLHYIEKLSDGAGMIQHANFTVPNRKDGYCTDDNARALLMSVMAYRQMKITKALELSSVYLSFIHYMQNEDGTFRNFLSYDRKFLDKIGSEDSFGRAVWSLGYLIRFSPEHGYFQLAKSMFLKSLPNFKKLNSLRGMAFTLIGIAHYLHHSPNNLKMKDALKDLTTKILKQYDQSKSEGWHWFESKLTYANGILPLSLLHSYEIYPEKNALETAKESMEFLKKATFIDGHLSLVGSDHWFEKGGEKSKYAQQPLDAMAMVLMAFQAYVVLKDPVYIELLSVYFMWFLGENDLGIPVYNFETFGCCDGIEAHGINPNQGAESTLSYLISHLTVLLAHE